MSKLPIPFDNPTTYKGHSGVDYGQPRGTPFRASGPGRVTTRGRNNRGGYYIWVQYDAGVRVGYHHMDSHAGCPKVGARVVEGTQLGYVGNTGNSTGPHLHSEISGEPTTAGYWRHFTADRVVGQPAPAALNDNQEDPTMILRIKGKAGERRGGLYLVQGNQATFIGARRTSAYPLFSDEGEIKILQSRINGLR